MTRNPCLMVGFSGSQELRMFRVKDEFGTVEPFMSISAPSPLRYVCGRFTSVFKIDNYEVDAYNLLI